jgi:hypothetical protein
LTAIAIGGMRFRFSAGRSIKRSVEPRGDDLRVEMVLVHLHLLT